MKNVVSSQTNADSRNERLARPGKALRWQRKPADTISRNPCSSLRIAGNAQDKVCTPRQQIADWLDERVGYILVLYKLFYFYSTFSDSHGLTNIFVETIDPGQSRPCPRRSLP